MSTRRSGLTSFLGRARRVLFGAPVAAAIALLPFAAARAADEIPLASCPPPTQALTAENLSAGLANATDHGFIWRISKDGRTSYLYGTIHAAKFEWMFPGPTVLDAVRASDTVALELDVLDPEIRRRIAAAIGRRGDERLPPALAARIAKLVAAECVDTAVWSGMAPELQLTS
ncbi:MAG: TraB/GumN family protein, partial [Pseudomonadota bacterium]|nr:TraB/GumN family protein [Pseudomonadota bacterium]